LRLDCLRRVALRPHKTACISQNGGCGAWCAVAVVRNRGFWGGTIFTHSALGESQCEGGGDLRPESLHTQARAHLGCSKGPAARSEGPEAAILAAVRSLGPVRSWVGLGVVRGVQLGPTSLAPGPLGSVAGDPDRHRRWFLCPSSVPAAAGRGLRPRVFPAHRPAPQLQVHAPQAWGVKPQ
jgi:hypothetical protein